MSKLELLEEKMRYELFLLDIIRKYCIDDEIAFTEEQEDEIPVGFAHVECPDSKMAYYNTGTISGVESYKVYIKANYNIYLHGTGDDGIDAEPIEFDLVELMQISSIGELIEEKIKCKN